MKFRLKTLFAIIAISALFLASIAKNQGTLREVRRLQEIVNESLADIEDLESVNIDKSEFRDDFVLFSSGVLNWNIIQDGQDEAQIATAWRSVGLFGGAPSISVTHRDTNEGIWIAREFERTIGDRAAEISFQPESE